MTVLSTANKTLTGPVQEETVRGGFQTVTNAGGIECDHSGGYNSVTVWGYKTSIHIRNPKLVTRNHLLLTIMVTECYATQ